MDGWIDKWGDVGCGGEGRWREVERGEMGGEIAEEMCREILGEGEMVPRGDREIRR